MSEIIYNKSRGGSIPLFIECINRYKDKWRVRWDIRAEEVTDYFSPSNEDGTHPTRTEYTWYEADFMPGRPSIDKMREVIINWYNNEVNYDSYFIDEKELWYSESDRMSMIDKCKNTSASTVSVTLKDSSSIELSPSIAQQAMENMNEYSIKCSNFKSSVINKINSSETIDAINSIDMRSGFPQVIHSTTDSLSEEVTVKNSNSPEVQANNLAYEVVNTLDIPAETALKMIILYPIWGEGLASIGTKVSIGFRCRVLNGDDKLYECINPHEINESYKPGTEEGNPYWMRISLDHEPTLEEAKFKKLGEITAYDTSSEVNSFYLNGLQVWLDKDTRVGLMNSTQIEKAAGHETTTLWLGSMSLVINCDLAIKLLSALELYALKCYNKTAEHKSNVNSLEDIESVNNYDYTIGYPEKLNLSTTDGIQNGITGIEES